MMKRKYIIISIAVLLAVILSGILIFLHLNKKPETYAINKELFAEAFSGKIKPFPENSFYNPDCREGVFEVNGIKVAYLIEGGTYEDEWYATEENYLKYKDKDVSGMMALEDGGYAHFYFDLWEHMKFRRGRVESSSSFSEIPKSEDVYVEFFEYGRDNFHIRFRLYCAGVIQDKTEKAMYERVVQQINENIMDITQWQKEHGYDIQE